MSFENMTDQEQNNIETNVQELSDSELSGRLDAATKPPMPKASAEPVKSDASKQAITKAEKPNNTQQQAAIDYKSEYEKYRKMHETNQQMIKRQSEELGNFRKKAHTAINAAPPVDVDYTDLLLQGKFEEAMEKYNQKREAVRAQDEFKQMIGSEQPAQVGQQSDDSEFVQGRRSEILNDVPEIETKPYIDEMQTILAEKGVTPENVEFAINNFYRLAPELVYKLATEVKYRMVLKNKDKEIESARRNASGILDKVDKAAKQQPMIKASSYQASSDNASIDGLSPTDMTDSELSAALKSKIKRR